MNASLLFLKDIVLEESSREGNTKESEQLNGLKTLLLPTWERPPLLLEEFCCQKLVSMFVIQQTVADSPCPVPSHLTISLSLKVQRMTPFGHKT